MGKRRSDAKLRRTGDFSHRLCNQICEYLLSYINPLNKRNSVWPRPAKSCLIELSDVFCCWAELFAAYGTTLNARLSPSDARRCISRPAAAAKSPGNSPDTDSLPRTTCVWITWSVPVSSNSTAPTSRVPPDDSRFHARRFAANVVTSPASTRRTLGLDATSRRKAVSRYRSGVVDQCQTGSSINSPFGYRCETRRPMFPHDSVESKRMEAAFGFFATIAGGCGSCGSNNWGSSVRFGAVAGRRSWHGTNAKLANAKRKR